MATLTITKNYSDTTTLDESDLDPFKDDTESTFNSTKLNNANFQAGAFTTAKIATDAVDKTIINADVVDDSTLEQAAGGELQIKDSGISTAKIADDNITQDKVKAKTTGSTVSAGDFAISSASGSFTTSAGSATDITNLTVTITTNGNPVFLMIQGDGSTNECSISISKNSTTTVAGDIDFKRGASQISAHRIRQIGSTHTPQYLEIAPSAFKHIDDVAAGTYTYKCTANSIDTSTTLAVTNCKLIAFEI